MKCTFSYSFMDNIILENLLGKICLFDYCLHVLYNEKHLIHPTYNLRNF
uniref:Uncharacterized protein n=1 Tax=Arundo donax TaxID=35708 RepID=A0A0A9DSJ3_ARUDO